MYTYKKVKMPYSCAFTRSDIDFANRPKYHPMSYYVYGGVDIDGDALSMNASTSFDDDEQLDGVDCGIDGTSDPRVSAFDIVEKAGVDAYEKWRAETARSQSTEQNKQLNE